MVGTADGYPSTLSTGDVRPIRATRLRGCELRALFTAAKPETTGGPLLSKWSRPPVREGWRGSGGCDPTR